MKINNIKSCNNFGSIYEISRVPFSVPKKPKSAPDSSLRNYMLFLQCCNNYVLYEILKREQTGDYKAPIEQKELILVPDNLDDGVAHYLKNGIKVIRKEKLEKILSKQIAFLKRNIQGGDNELVFIPLAICEALKNGTKSSYCTKKREDINLRLANNITRLFLDSSEDFKREFRPPKIKFVKENNKNFIEFEKIEDLYGYCNLKDKGLDLIPFEVSKEDLESLKQITGIVIPDLH